MHSGNDMEYEGPGSVPPEVLEELEAELEADAMGLNKLTLAELDRDLEESGIDPTGFVESIRELLSRYPDTGL